MREGMGENNDAVIAASILLIKWDDWDQLG